MMSEKFELTERQPIPGRVETRSRRRIIGKKILERRGDGMSDQSKTTEGRMIVGKEVADRFPEPAFLYETLSKMEKSFDAARNNYILTRSQELGINPLVVIQQSELIRALRTELSDSIMELAALREQIAREVYVTLQEWDLKCDCPRYPDGETWDGHCCLLFAVVDEITKSTDISDAITRGVTE